MNNEIFCKNCRFYKNDPFFKYPIGKNTGTDVHTTCNCQYNIDTHYGAKDPRRFISAPSIINRCHDCNWFERSVDMNTYVWDCDKSIPKKYKDHGPGTYNINPYGGENGFYIGDKNLKQIIKENAGQEVKELEERLSVVEVKVVGHEEKIQQLEIKVSGHDEQIVKNKQDISDLKDRLNVDEANINALTTRVTTAETNINQNKQDITDLKSRVTTNETEISNLKSRVTSDETDINKNKQDIANLNSTTVIIQNDITEIKSDVDVLEEKVEQGAIIGKTILDGGKSTVRPDVD